MIDEFKIRRLLSRKGLDEDDFAVWVKKWKALKGSAYARDARCLLTLSQYIRLAAKAGMTSPDQIGIGSKKFNMSRIGDTGDYEWGNCRFLTMRANQLEKHDNGGYSAQSAKMQGRTKATHPGLLAISKALSKTFSFVSPSGKVHDGSGLGAFAEKHGLNASQLSKLNRKVIASYRGWTLNE